MGRLAGKEIFYLPVGVVFGFTIFRNAKELFQVSLLPPLVKNMLVLWSPNSMLWVQIEPQTPFAA